MLKSCLILLGTGAVVKNSVLGSNVIVEPGCSVENAVIGQGFKLEAGKKYCDETFLAK
jgi:ADP-glucose pyrophosphorylase